MMKIKILFSLAALLLLLGLLAPPVRADAGYAITWWNISGGGAVNAPQSGYSLSGAIGQPIAGAAEGTGFSLHSGFWVLSAVHTCLYLPQVIHGSLP